MRFLGIDPELDRPRIQALRASPPGYATRGIRREIFGSSLEQWDALLAASGAVIPSVSPILLFYALSQAGRAVCAARVAGQPFRPRRHGLSIGDPAGDIGALTVSPEGGANSSFAMFCRAVGTEPLAEPTTLGALWAANSHLTTTSRLGAPAAPAIPVGAIGGDGVRALLAGSIAEGLPTDESEAADELTRRLVLYPHASDGLQVRNELRREGPNGTSQVEVRWLSRDGTPKKLDMVVGGFGRPNSGHFLRPALNQAGDVLDILPLWWATLLALSSLARYHPEAWRGVLTRDRSPEAVPVEDALQIGREILPWLLIGVLSDN